MNNSPPGASPGDYLLYSDSYHSAAKTLFHNSVVHSGITIQGLDIHHLLPGLTLVCLCLELALKGFLLSKGKDESWLKLKIGHDLKKAFKQAKSHGLTVIDKSLASTADSKEVSYLHDLYATQALRYPVVTRHFVGDPEYLSLARRVLLACAQACGVNQGLCVLSEKASDAAVGAVLGVAGSTSGPGRFHLWNPPQVKRDGDPR